MGRLLCPGTGITFVPKPSLQISFYDGRQKLKISTSFQLQSTLPVSCFPIFCEPFKRLLIVIRINPVFLFSHPYKGCPLR